MDRFLLIALLLAPTAADFAAAQTVNPPCYICFDGGVSSITRPDAVIPLPDFVGIPTATCAQLQKAAEVDLLIPESFCSQLDDPDIRVACGCALPVTTAPVPAPVPVTTAPVAATTAPVASTTAPVAPTTAPVAPTAAPTEDPECETTLECFAETISGFFASLFGGTDGECGALLAFLLFC